MFLALILIIGFAIFIQSLNIGDSLYSYIDYKMTSKFWHPHYFKKASSQGFADLYLLQLEYRNFPVTHFACVRSYTEAKAIHLNKSISCFKGT